MRSHSAAVLVLAMLGGACGGGSVAWSGTAEPWETYEGLDPRPVVLRRRHAVGDEYRKESTTRMSQTQAGVVGDRLIEPVTIPADTRFEGYDVVTDATPDGPFVVQQRRLALDLHATDLDDDPVTSSIRQWSTDTKRISSRNEWIDRPPPVEPSDAPVRVELPVIVTLGPDDIVYPLAPVRAGERWSHSFELTVGGGETAVTRLTLTLTWTFRGVERVGDAELAHVTCEGRWRSRLDLDRGADIRLQWRGEGRVACAARIDLRDGYAGRWRIDQQGTGLLERELPTERSRVEVTGEARTLYVIERVATDARSPTVEAESE